MGRGCLKRLPQSTRRVPQRQHPACARPRAALPHAHAHAQERRTPASPALSRRQARTGAQDSERETGAPGGAGAREQCSCIRSTTHEAPPLPRPPLLPRAGSARPKPRACARVRRPGPSRGGPVDSNESVALSRINPFYARQFRGRSGSVPAQAGGAPSPQPAPRMHGKGGVLVGVFTAG